MNTKREIKKIIRFIKFLAIDVWWVGFKFFLGIPLVIWEEFESKEKK